MERVEQNQFVIWKKDEDKAERDGGADRFANTESAVSGYKCSTARNENRKPTAIRVGVARADFLLLAWAMRDVRFAQSYNPSDRVRNTMLTIRKSLT